MRRTGCNAGVGVMMIALLLVLAAPAGAAPRNNPALTAHEQGTLELIEPVLRAVESDLKNMYWWQDIANSRKTGWLANFSSGRSLVFSKGLREGSMALYRQEMNYRGPPVVLPESLHDLRNAYRQLILVGGEFIAAEPNLASEEIWGRLFSACHELTRAEARFYAAVRARGAHYASVDMSYNLSLELKPIPLKLDFLKNEIKVTRSASIGPISISGGAGVSGSRTGITTLIVVGEGGKRFYATGGRSIQFQVPASTVLIEGSTMTIEAL